MKNSEKVLIVDDEEDIREGIVLTNKVAHRSFKEAGNGVEALAILKEETFDAIICDVSMPKISGIELLKMARELGITTPFIFLSGHAEEDILSQIENKGTVLFVEKTSIRQLPQIVTDIIARQSN
jgi:two-component system chemotaxis response regulator CheY